MKHRPKHLIEYALLRSVGAFFQILPYRVALFIGWCIAQLLFVTVRFRLDEAKARIREVCGQDLTDRDVRRIAWISFRNLVFNVIESIRVPGMSLSWAKKVFISYTDLDRVRSSDGRGAVIAVPHMGNWDLSAIMAHMLGFPAFILTRPQKNPLVSDYLDRVRSAKGMDVTHRGTFEVRTVVKQLKKDGILMITPDLRSATEETPTRFLGKAANISPGVALFAKMANVPIWPVIVTRIGWTKHEWSFRDPIYPDAEMSREEDAQRMMQELLDHYSAAVLKEPEQFFWYNKRWVLEPWPSKRAQASS